MKKFTMLLAALLLMSGLTWAQTTINWTAADQGYENQQEITSVDFDANVSGNFAKGTSNNSPKYYTNGTAIRCYGGNTITIVSSDANLTTISITFGSSDGTNAITTDVGTYSDGTWTGDAEEVTFTIGGTSGNRRIAGFAITYGGTPAPITYTVTYDCNGGTSGCPENVTNIEPGTQIQLADAPSRDNYDFDGWSDGTEIYGENEDYTVNGNVTFTAQWTPQSSGDEQWVLTNLADLTESDVFVIVGNNGSTYAMSNDKGTGNPPVAVAVTVTNDVITSTVEESIQWTVSGNATDGYTFYPNGSTTTWLYCTNTNNGVRVGTNNAKTFVINSDYLYHNGTSRHVGIYNSQDWRCYTPQSGAVHNNIAGQTFAFYKKVTDGVVPPTITAANVELAYDVVAGEIAYTVNNPVEGGVLTAEVTEGFEWISADEDEHTEASGTVALITDANTTTTARTATVTLTYTYENRETVTKEVTVTQAAAPVIYTTIPALFEAATNTETDVTVTFGGWVISAVKNSNAYLTDNAGNGLIIYQSDHGFQVNDVLTGTASCKLQAYRGSAELKNLTATTEGLTVTPNGTVTVQDIAISELSGVNTGALVAYENLTYTDGKLQDSEGNQITPYTTLYDYGNIFVEGHIYNVTGIYLQYNTTKEILPRSTADIEEVTLAEPSITVEPATVSVPATEADGTLTVTYENITEIVAEVYFCDADGEAATYDWITAEINDENNVYYVIDANEGEARTAYLKVYALDDAAGDVYSNLVTVNQAAYEAPATTGTIVFGTNGTKINAAEVTGTDSFENAWTITTVGTTSFTQNAAYSQVGSSNSPAESITFTTTLPQEATITAFSAKFGGFNGTAGDVNLYVGETNVGTGSLNGTADVIVESTATEAGTTLTVTVTNIDKGVKCYYISYSISLGTDPIINVPASVNLASDATAGEFDYSIINPVTGETLTATSTDEWISNIVVTDDKVTFVTTANTETTERQGTITVSYAGAEDKTVTVIQDAYVAPVIVENYALFTGDLIEGDYLIVYDNGAMNTTVTSNRLQFTEVEPENDVIGTDNAAIVWHIAKSGDYWTIYNAAENAYAASNGTKNQAQMLADGTDDKALWTVSGMETFEFVNKYNQENEVNANLRKNGTYGFACYSVSTGGALTLYKKVTTTATHTLAIEGYGTSDGGYYLIASPIYGLNPANVEGMTTGDFDLYTFDQAEEGAEWRNYEAEAFYLTPGKGYLYAKSTDETLTFTGMPYEGDGVVTLSKTDGVAWSGWNLIGNPFGEEAYFGQNFYRMNENGSEIVAVSGGVMVAPMEGIFVLAEEDGDEVEFGIVGSIPGPIDDPQKLVLNLNHNQEAFIDRAIIRFDESNQLPKFQLNPNSTKICFTLDETDFAVVRSDAQGEMPVSFKAAENGTYTLSVNVENMDVDYLHLIDNMTGMDIDLLQTPSYSFEANTTDYTTRFRLVFSTSTSIGENNDSFAFFSNGRFIVSNEGQATLQVIDVTGRIVSDEIINGTCSVSVDTTPGVYMLRLVSGNNVKIQKVVVK